MAILLTEGFDWLQTSDLAAPYSAMTIRQPVGTMTKSIETGRTGKCLRIIPGAAASDNVYTNLQGFTFPFTVTAGTTFVHGFAMRWNTVPTDGLGFFWLLNVPSVIECVMGRNADGTVTIGRVITSAWTTVYGTTSSTLDAGVWNYIEVKFNGDNSTGSVIVNINGVEEINFSGDSLQSGDNYVSVSLGTTLPVTVVPSVDFDDMYILDTTGSDAVDILGDVVVQTLLPDGNGTTSQWTGSDADSTDNYLHVDETNSDDDTSYVEDTTTGNKDLYNYGATSGLSSIYSVTAKTIAKKVDAGANDIVAVCRSNVTESDSAALGMNTSYAAKSAIYENDPNTGVAWTTGGVDAAEFGVKTN